MSGSQGGPSAIPGGRMLWEMRSHDVPKKTYIPLFLHTIVGPDYYFNVPPEYKYLRQNTKHCTSETWRPKRRGRLRRATFPRARAEHGRCTCAPPAPPRERFAKHMTEINCHRPMCARPTHDRYAARVPVWPGRYCTPGYKV